MKKIRNFQSLLLAIIILFSFSSCKNLKENPANNINSSDISSSKKEVKKENDKNKNII